MTDLQEKQLHEYRIKGFGYKAIASVLGLSRDVVRNYCKSHSLEGFASEVAVNIEEQIQQGTACLCCGKAIQQPAMGRKRKFCSDKCRRQWWLAHPEAVRKKETALYEKTCVYCGKSFIVYGNRNRRYCRHECYVSKDYEKGEYSSDSLPSLYKNIMFRCFVILALFPA